MRAFEPQHMMIDIETFGLRPAGLIVSIGAVVFCADPEAPLLGPRSHEFHAALSWDAAMEEIERGRFEISQDTMRWWREDNAQAFSTLKNMMQSSALGAEQLLGAFGAWAKPYCDQGVKVWGNAPSFDIVLIENMCKKMDVPFVIPFRAEGDYRTLMDRVYGADKPKGAPVGHHDALSDARFQARCCARAIQTLDMWKSMAPAIDWRDEPPARRAAP